MLTFSHHLFRKATERQLVFFWLAFCFLALTYKLDGVPPYHSDENYYVESTRNMVESGDYLTPIYQDKKRFAKPILYYWLMSVSYKIFGVSLISARLISAIFGSLAIGLLYLISSRLFDGRIALYSSLILPSTYMHFQISRWATTDIVMNFFILLALYFFIRLYQGDFSEKKYIYLFYLAMAFGFMTKGPPAIIIPSMVVLAFLLVTGKKRFLSQMHIGRGLAILLLVILPWFVTMLFLHGNEFKDHIIGAEITNRLVHDTPYSLYFFWALFRYNLPWIFFLIVEIFRQLGIINYSRATGSGVSEYFAQVFNSIKTHFRLLFARGNESALFCYIWIVVCLILFTLVRTEHSRYMLPASSAVSMLVAKIFSDIEKSRADWLSHKIPLVITGGIFLVLALVTARELYIFELIYHIPLSFFILPILFFLAGISIFRLIKKRRFGKQIFIISFSLVFSFSFLSGQVLPHINRYPMKLFSEKILSDRIAGPIGVYRLGNQRARLGVLTGQKVVGFSQPIQMQEFVESDEQVLLVISEKDFRNNLSSISFKVLSEDVAWLRSRVGRDRLLDFLWKGGPATSPSSFTEKIYLLSNK